ncbi:MAG: putative lipopolysaccharide heptosyltransferase [Betaproteobacteria bacterium]|nr:putative lipopolysaccharide heptosyltransferase [Betaproteobacteria bacterium]
MNARAPQLDFTQPPRNVLLIVTRRIGDVLLATPVVRSLKRAWPGTKIDMLVFAGTEGFVAANREVSRVLTVPERPALGRHLKLAARIARRYDLALSLVPGDRPTLYAFVAGKQRAGLLVPTAKERWKQRLLNAWVPFDNDDTHTVRMHLALLDTIGIAPVAEVVPAWTREDEAHVQALLAPLGRTPYAVIHPYPKFRYKMWTQQGWGDIARWLKDRGVRVVLTGGPDAAEREYVAAIAGQAPDALNLAGVLSLGGVACVVSRAAVFVGPDTAITHAAAALGVPTVALFGPSDPVKWGPWPAGHDVHANPWQLKGSQASAKVRLVQGAGPCVPCRNEGCDKHVESSSDCLTNMSSLTVIAALSEVLSAPNTKN